MAAVILRNFSEVLLVTVARQIKEIMYCYLKFVCDVSRRMAAQCKVQFANRPTFCL